MAKEFRQRRALYTLDEVVRALLPPGAQPQGDQVRLRVRDHRIDRELDLGAFGAELVLEWMEPAPPAPDPVPGPTGGPPS